jgi:hypothetical protein
LTLRAFRAADATARWPLSATAIAIAHMTIPRTVRGIFAGWNLVERLAIPVACPLTRTFVVVGTGVDPVTSRFSGARSTN